MTRAQARPTIEDVMALSPLQRGLFSMATLADAETDDDPYAIAMAADVTGPLDVPLLRDCAASMRSEPGPLWKRPFQNAAMANVASSPVAKPMERS